MPLIVASAFPGWQQGLGLGLGRLTGVAAGTLEGELQVPSLLNDPFFISDQEGLITNMRVGGQSLMASDQGFGWRMLHPQSQSEGIRAIGIPLHAQTRVTIDYTLAANGSALAGIGTDPVPRDEAFVPNAPEIADRLSYIFGLGSVSIPAGGTASLVGTSRRECDLGDMVIYSPTAAASLDVVVQNIEVNNAPLLAGRIGGTTPDDMPLVAFDYLRTDMEGRCLNVPIEFNQTVKVTLKNYNAAAITVYGGIFVLPQ